MNHENSPAFRFYASDFLTDTKEWTDEEVGIYIRLLCVEWVNGDLPSDTKRLSNLVQNSHTKFIRLWNETIKKKFRKNEENRLINPRMEKVRYEMIQYRKTKSEAGRVGGIKKWKSLSNPEKRSVRMSLARERGNHTKEEWEKMKEFFEHKCLICEKKEPKIRLCKDHIIPIYQGGSHGIDNIQPLCESCNARKGPDSTDHRKKIDPQLECLNFIKSGIKENG